MPFGIGRRGSGSHQGPASLRTSWKLVLEPEGPLVGGRRKYMVSLGIVILTQRLS